ncbi:MAG: DEAD/DEAH box helicase [Phycisphaerales bacterium]|nr:DEAD/DEAH box helicase [Phycisphaerales bacterium]
MQFSDLRLSPPILRALAQEGYTTPTPIQGETIPHILAGRDVLGCARTGTGKTAAFALPILERLSKAPADKSQRGPRKARALILSPTRELAVQIAQSFASYGRELTLENVTIYGGVSQVHQVRALRRGVDIIVATPGRLMDLMEQRVCDLSGIEVLVLDEADRMLDMGFIDPIRRIAAATPAAKRQTLLFSATMPKEIAHLASSMLRDPARVAVDAVSSAVPAIQQGVYMVGRHDKQNLLEHLVLTGSMGRVLVFTRTKHGADRVGKRLAREGLVVDTIHGNKSQSQRQRALERFRGNGPHARGARVLVATDVAARGLDVDDITHVINFDLPIEPEAYVHRIGRTGRAGAAGIAVSFCDGEERGTLREIERLLGKKIDVHPTPQGLILKPEPERGPRPAHPPHRGGGHRRQAGPRGGSRPGGGRPGGGQPHPGHTSSRPTPPAEHRRGPGIGHDWRKPIRSAGGRPR